MKKLAIIVIILGGLVLNSCEFEVTTAHVKDIKLCNEIYGTFCDNDQTVFNPGDPEIILSCKLKNAPENTHVVFTWKYMEEPPVVIDQITLNSADKGTTLDLKSSLSRPNNGWPKGKYAVEIGIGDNDDSPKVKHFEVR